MGRPKHRVEECIHAVHSTGHKLKSERVKTACELLARLRHLLVFRVHEYTAPTLFGTSFSSGKVVGDGLFYRVSDGK